MEIAGESRYSQWQIAGELRYSQWQCQASQVTHIGNGRRVKLLTVAMAGESSYSQW